MLGMKPDEFDPERPEHKDVRQKAKAVNFAVIYGSGPSGLKEFARNEFNLQLTVEEGPRVDQPLPRYLPGRSSLAA